MVPHDSTSDEKGAERDRLSRIMQTLQGSTAVSYVVDSQSRFVYCNPAWDSFARSNDAPELVSESVIGTDLFEAIPEVLRGVYSDAFRNVLSTGKVWEESYECSSPAVFRMFRMRIHLLRPQNWFLITNALVFERSHRNVAEPDAGRYVDSDGLITMCAHCRCSRRAHDPNQWDFIPEYLELKGDARRKVSHALCPVCRVYFYPFHRSRDSQE
jgi:hypothetical protein